jgi:hypothetical protein
MDEYVLIMNTFQNTNIFTVIDRLLNLFRGQCDDTVTIDKMVACINDWDPFTEDPDKNSEDIFSEIRRKNLVAVDVKDKRLFSQYCFEEICAKTLYNLTRPSAPFDPDSPYWIIPNAIAFSRTLGLSDDQILSICNPDQRSD